MSMNLVRAWWQRYFSDPQALILLVLLVGRSAGSPDNGKHAGTGIRQYCYCLFA